VFRARARFREWFGPSGRLMLALAAVTLVSAGSLSWLGWQMLRQDADVEAQREQERLEHQADLAVQSIERLLASTEERLADWVSRPSAPVPDPTDGGLVATFTPATVVPSASSRLLFYPELPRPPEPPPQLFADGEVAEFQQHDSRRAIEIFRALAQSPDRAVRAAALMRMGRTLRTSARHAESLAVYSEMAALDDVPVVGLPAELVARSATIEVLNETGRHDDARQEAQALGDDLKGSRWKLTRGQFEYYFDAAAAASGSLAAAKPDDLAIARATADLWLAWKSGLPPSGRRSMHEDGVSLLASWRSAPDRTAVWIVRPDELLNRLSTDSHVSIALSDADGAVVAGVLDGPGRRAIRTPRDSRLPWTVHARGAADDATRAGLTRGRVIVLGLGMMLTFLIAGSYFIARAVQREVDLARLQSDFVSAVSHEFRTPLAAMRQLSELLAAGRVAREDRRQQYYESIAGESRRLQRLVENLLNFGRLQAGARPYQLEPMDPRALVQQVVSEFQSQLSQPDCQIEVIGDPEPGRIMADPDAIALALHNLLDNAVKYGGVGGSISVTCGRHGERIALSVRDHGPGIPADERTRIFDRFVRGTVASTANVRGTGIGLAMVQQVIKSHGGAVTVESSPGAGSTFTMWLPIADHAA
jgi:signal transduction histidine kinase